jgi:MinD-like ATPase involved in chromosome partitioning or flagellar assembly
MSRVIAIAGAKGSPGCSFLAVALGCSLAESQVSTLVFDADAEGGGIAALLDLGSADSNEADSVDETGMQVGPNLWFAETGRAGAALSGLDWLAAARERHRVVIVDLGHSSGSLQRQLSAASDWLLWVVVPDRSGLRRADAALASGVLGAASVGLIFNRVRRGCLEGAEAALADRHRLPVLGRFAEDRRVAERMTHSLPPNRVRSVRRPLTALRKAIYPASESAVPGWK